MPLARQASHTIVLFFLLLCCGNTNRLFSQTPTKGSNTKFTKTKKGKVILYGQASFYATKFEGRKTASGAIFKQAKYTAACNALPLNTWVKITNLKNKKSVVVQINDRLHPKTTRLTDLSQSAARKLNYLGEGLTRVKVEVLPAQTVAQ